MFLKIIHPFSMNQGNLCRYLCHPTDGEYKIPRLVHRRLYFLLSRVYDASFHVVKARFGHSTATMQVFMRCDQKGKPKSYQRFPFALCSDPLNATTHTDLPQSQVLYAFGQVLFCSLFLEKSQSAELAKAFWELAPAKLQAAWSVEQRKIIREILAVYRVRLPLQRLQSTDSLAALTLDSLAELARCPAALFETLSPSDQARFRFEAELGDDTEQEEASSVLFTRSREDRFPSLMMRFLDFDPDNRLRFGVDLGQLHYHVRLKAAEHFTDQQARLRSLGQKILAYGRLQAFEQVEKPATWQLLETNYTQVQTEAEALIQANMTGISTLRPYLIPAYPHYHYFPDRLGFRIATDPQQTASYPELAVSATNEAVRLEPPSASSMQPQFWMSHEQLLHLSFYHYLWKTQGAVSATRLDSLLLRYESGMKNVLKALAREPTLGFSSVELAQTWLDQIFASREQFAVPLKSLPKVLVQHLLAKRSAPVKRSMVEQRLRHLLDETDYRLSQIKTVLASDKKRGQQGFKILKCGPIGDFLAEDFLRFQPSDASKPDGGKLNSQHYQILQKTLAYYGAHVEEPPKIADLLADCGLLSGALAHPFLGRLGLATRADKYHGLISFYEAYLQARRRFIQDYLAKPKQWSLNQLPAWLGLRQAASFDNWCAELWDGQRLKQPLPVPDHFLYRPILNLVAKALQLEAADLEREGSVQYTKTKGSVSIPPSITWLLKRYLAGQGQQVQAMYSYPRQHGLLDTWLDRRTQQFAEKQKHYRSEAERQQLITDLRTWLLDTKPAFGKPPQSETTLAKREKLSALLKAYQQDELQIRHAMAQDRLLYLYAQQYLERLTLADASARPNWGLQGLEHTLLNTSLRQVLDIPLPKKPATSIRYLARALVHPACKLRDWGSLRVLVRDRRLQGLLVENGGYYPDLELELHHEEIRAELLSYQRVRVQLMQRVHKLETRISQKLGAIPKRDAAEFKQNPEFGGGRYGDFLQALYQHQQQQAAHLAGFELAAFNQFRLIRNAFAHNQYPLATEFPQLVQAVRAEPVPVNPANHRKVAERLYAQLEGLSRAWLRYLQ
ncbi:MAG: hypothetical protein E6Q85_09360 [Thiothrix sp.]|nr:MAG: hypothetical protein E6Q85_09360 [Thiothrix sp.]